MKIALPAMGTTLSMATYTSTSFQIEMMMLANEVVIEGSEVKVRRRKLEFKPKNDPTPEANDTEDRS